MALREMPKFSPEEIDVLPVLDRTKPSVTRWYQKGEQAFYYDTKGQMWTIIEQDGWAKTLYR